MKAKASHASSPRNYRPLLVLLAVVALAAIARQFALNAFSGRIWMHDFMGFFLAVFAMLKLFDLGKFADGFAMYDVLAHVARPYAYVYPFLELALGLGYLSHRAPEWVYGATIVILGFGAIGVIRALLKGLDLNCACMGNLLKVPLSTVALVEDLGMAAMAAAMWVWR